MNLAAAQKVVDKLAVFRQDKNNALHFKCFAHFGLSDKGKEQLAWLRARGLDVDNVAGDDIYYTITFTDPETAMLFKLSFI